MGAGVREHLVYSCGNPHLAGIRYSLRLRCSASGSYVLYRNASTVPCQHRLRAKATQHVFPHHSQVRSASSTIVNVVEGGLHVKQYRGKFLLAAIVYLSIPHPNGEDQLGDRSLYRDPSGR